MGLLDLLELLDILGVFLRFDMEYRGWLSRFSQDKLYILLIRQFECDGCNTENQVAHDSKMEQIRARDTRTVFWDDF